jgi:TonB family protein
MCGPMMRPVVAGLIASLALCGCGMMGAGGPEPAAKVEAGGAGKPEFFVQWRTDLPGITRRPALAKGSVLPEYPPAAVRDEISGTTTLETCLSIDGVLVGPRIAQSSGSPLLDEATLAWAQVARFQPAEINGEPFAICGYRFDQEWRVAAED